MPEWLPLVYIPIGVLGVIRWATWLIRRVVATQYHPHEGEFDATLTVVSPVYQEDPEVFERAIRSWLANDTVTEVICVTDVTDIACRDVANRLADEDRRLRQILTEIPGKRDALKTGWEAANGEIIALVDSDTIWAEDVGYEVLRPFSSPDVGAVATRQNVYEPRSLWQHVADFYLDYRYYDELAAQTAWGRAISCVSGRTAVYRRSILVDNTEEFMNERFLGVPCNSGDDKRLTCLTLQDGSYTYLQRTARVWSSFPSDRKTFMQQRLRWSRNTWRSDLRALFSRWVWRHPFLALSMIDKAVSPFTALLAPAFFVFAVIRGDYWVVAIMLIWWFVSRGAKAFPHLRRRPVDVLLMPVFILISFVMSVVRIRALLTIRAQRWLTREVAVVDGTVMRTTQTEGDQSEEIREAAEAGDVLIDLRDPVELDLTDAAEAAGDESTIAIEGGDE